MSLYIIFEFVVPNPVFFYYFACAHAMTHRWRELDWYSCAFAGEGGGWKIKINHR